jgi:hypothetical protein
MKALPYAVLAAVTFVGGFPGTGSAPLFPPSRSLPRSGGGGSLSLRQAGTVNLTSPRPAVPPSPAAGPARRGAAWHAVPLGRPPFIRRPALTPPVPPRARQAAAPLAGNVPGEAGFTGITAAINDAVNSPAYGGLGYVSPPDQGLAVGPSPEGTVLLEFVNQSLVVYARNGRTLAGAIPAYQVFGVPPNAPLADPRAYWDPEADRWFLTMFTAGQENTAGQLISPSDEYIAVSQTADPLAGYKVFSVDTTDRGQPGCPCYGDFDQVGADRYGFYITTNEYGISGNAYNGAIVYAMSKAKLAEAASQQGVTVPVLRYRVPADAFGQTYHLSPASVPPGQAMPGKEYFVESDGDAASGTGLEIYALLHTAVLDSGGRPVLVSRLVSAEQYSTPPNAPQKPGPTPYGTSLGQGEGVLQSDFDAVQEVTWAGGNLYAALDTGVTNGTSTQAGAAWFILHPAIAGGQIQASVVQQGYLVANQDLLYPVIAVNSQGFGYMAFSLAGSDTYPSPGYVAFSPQGVQGPVRLATAGADPLDDFSCYPPYSFGDCRYGDYSMAVAYRGRIYMATEYVPPVPRDQATNWGTYLWSAPA